MDKNKTTPLTGLIAKLTLAANKAVRKAENPKKTEKHYIKADLGIPFNVDSFDRNFHTAKLLK